MSTAHYYVPIISQLEFSFRLHYVTTFKIILTNFHFCFFYFLNEFICCIFNDNKSFNRFRLLVAL